MHAIQNFLGPNYFSWSASKVPPSDFIQKNVSGSVQVLKQIYWIFSKMHHSIWKILFVLGADEKQEGKIRKCLFFYVKIFLNNSVLYEFVYDRRCVRKLKIMLSQINKNKKANKIKILAHFWRIFGFQPNTVSVFGYFCPKL